MHFICLDAARCARVEPIAVYGYVLALVSLLLTVAAEEGCLLLPSLLLLPFGHCTLNEEATAPSRKMLKADQLFMPPNNGERSSAHGRKLAGQPAMPCSSHLMVLSDTQHQHHQLYGDGFHINGRGFVIHHGSRGGSGGRRGGGGVNGGERGNEQQRDVRAGIGCMPRWMAD